MSGNKKRLIWFWHGRNELIEQRIASFCKKEQDGDKHFYSYEGSLDDFADHYGRPFIVFKSHIAVSQHNSFNQR